MQAGWHRRTGTDELQLWRAVAGVNPLQASGCCCCCFATSRHSCRPARLAHLQCVRAAQVSQQHVCLPCCAPFLLPIPPPPMHPTPPRPASTPPAHAPTQFKVPADLARDVVARSQALAEEFVAAKLVAAEGRPAGSSAGNGAGRGGAVVAAGRARRRAQAARDHGEGRPVMTNSWDESILHA